MRTRATTARKSGELTDDEALTVSRNTRSPISCLAVFASFLFLLKDRISRTCLSHKQGKRVSRVRVICHFLSGMFLAEGNISESRASDSLIYSGRVYSRDITRTFTDVFLTLILFVRRFTVAWKLTDYDVASRICTA